jgi:broad specificity phosphatase PhoE
MTQRAVKALESIASQHPGGRVVVVTHGGFISAVHRKVVGRFSYRTPNCSIGRLRIDPGSDDDDDGKKREEGGGSSVWAVVSWADVDHLKDADVDYEAAAFGGGTSG